MFRNHLGSLDVIEDTGVVFVTVLTYSTLPSVWFMSTRNRL